MVNYFGESAKTAPPSVFFPVFVRFIKAYKVRNQQMPDRPPVPPRFGLFPLPLHRQGTVFWCQTQMASGPVAVALAASVPQDVANTRGPNNRKGQLGLTLELQLWCLDWSPRCSSSFPPLPPDSRALPRHTAHILRLFSARIYGICSRKTCRTGNSAFVCVTL